MVSYDKTRFTAVESNQCAISGLNPRSKMPKMTERFSISGRQPLLGALEEQSTLRRIFTLRFQVSAKVSHGIKRVHGIN